ALVSRKTPLAPETVTTPPPSDRPTLVNVTVTTDAPAEVVRRSKSKLPVSVWPATVMLTAVPLTRRYGPAGTWALTVPHGRVSVVSTALVTGLTTRPNVPLSVTPVPPARETVADTCPASPWFDKSSVAEPLVTLTRAFVPSPRVSDTLLAVTAKTLLLL